MYVCVPELLIPAKYKYLIRYANPSFSNIGKVYIDEDEIWCKGHILKF
jgi:hypothetical protein